MSMWRATGPSQPGTFAFTSVTPICEIRGCGASDTPGSNWSAMEIPGGSPSGCRDRWQRRTLRRCCVMDSEIVELLPDRENNPGVVVERVELDGVEGPVTTLVHRPDRPGPHPAIALGAEATGVNEFLRRIAATLASRGFVTALPDYFRGDGPRDPDNYDDFDDILPHLDALDFTRATRDVVLAADMLVHRPDVDPHRLGVWGYCTGAT